MRTRPNTWWLFAAATVANLLPVFWFSYLPVSDGPSHVYNASLVSRYFLERAESVRDLIEFNRSVPPNMMAHALMALAMTLVAPATAERVLIALYGVLLPVSLRYALRGVSERTYGLEFIGLGLVFNSHLHWGFYNFLLGLAAYLFALGYWLRIRHDHLTLRRLAVMTGAVTAIYFCHPVPLLEFWVSVCVISAVEGWRSRTWRLSGLLHACVPSVPAAVLYIHYAMTRPPAMGMPGAGWPTLRYAGSLLVKLAPLATYTSIERISAMALSLGVAAAVLWALWRQRSGSVRPAGHGLLAAAAVSGLLMFLMPTDAAGGTLITPRLVYFPLFLALIWLAAGSWSHGQASSVVAAGLVLAVVSTAARWPVYQRYDFRMREFLAAARAESHAGAVHFQTAALGTTLVLDGEGVPYLSAGAWGYVSATHDQLLVNDYEAEIGYFPFVYRTVVKPSSYPLEDRCPIRARLVDAEEYRRRGGRPIDTFVMWVERDYAEAVPCIRSAMGPAGTELRTSQGTLLSFTPSHE